MLYEKLESILSDHGIYTKITSKELITQCPFCQQRGKDKKKLSINKDTLLWHCFVCGKAGSVFTLQRIFDSFSISESKFLLDDYIVEHIFDPYEKKMTYEAYETFLSDTELDIYKSNIEREHNRNMEELDKYTISGKNPNEIAKKVKNYIQSRSIEPVALDIMKIPYYFGVDDILKYRFIIPTFFGTNYEARTIIDDAEPRYLKRESAFTIPDFLFFFRKDHYFLFNQDSIEDIVLDEVYVVEGLFDCLKLFLGGLDSVSLGGHGNTMIFMFFLKALEKLKNIKVKKLVFIYDKDLSDELIQKNCDKINFEFSSLYNLEFHKFSYKDYKDIGAIELDDFPTFIKQLMEENIWVNK